LHLGANPILENERGKTALQVSKKGGIRIALINAEKEYFENEGEEKLESLRKYLKDEGLSITGFLKKRSLGRTPRKFGGKKRKKTRRKKSRYI